MKIHVGNLIMATLIVTITVLLVGWGVNRWIKPTVPNIGAPVSA